MNINNMCNDIVTVVNQDGAQHQNVRAQISENLVIIPNEKIPLSIGDTILRQLPSGLVERLVITNPGYQRGALGIPGHYQAKYRHEAAEQNRDTGTVLHISGANSRFNFNSIDNSTNSVTTNVENAQDLAAELGQLRSALATIATSAEHYVAMGALAEAEVAATENNGSKLSAALNRIGTGGKWAWETAQKISIPVASKALAAHLGL